jgi:hypothetical protein
MSCKGFLEKMSKIWVLRCKNCEGIMAGLDRYKLEREKKLHKEETGHRMRIDLEDRSVVDA